jgi:hypothetical protein
MKNRKLKNIIHTYAIYTSLIIAGGLIFGLAFTHAIDQSIKNQDTMLCNSAKRSGNAEYLNKCQCFYNTGDITCLRKEK